MHVFSLDCSPKTSITSLIIEGVIRSELPFVICTFVDVDVDIAIATRGQLPSHVPPMNDIGRRRSGGGADETFDGADTVDAARNEVPVSSSFDITPPMATAVIVIVIVLPSLADRRRRCPRP